MDKKAMIMAIMSNKSKLSKSSVRSKNNSVSLITSLSPLATMKITSNSRKRCYLRTVPDTMDSGTEMA